ncbi:MAG TPA: bifunctional 5,10-methylenetetrahydrofolate dehydrogenase/5,10-methenyltetrahydrofolate cyclohydrolase [Gaiellaceae bacterium]|nr:bifunctional 5,10-methylenetetrahydrofolate dehydrogenase/5,10-methenyltetrahydrofolate cyclohydrolase [Gaiellaceae bacterium]
MAARLMDGKGLAERLRAEIAEEVRQLGDVGLATVLVGDDPASDVYIRRKHEAAQEVGIRSIDHRLPAETSQDELERLVGELNADEGVDGILVQSPLPDHLDEETAVRLLDPGKDVDGFHPENAARLYMGEPRFVPATPVGIMRLLREYDVPLEGARAVVVGRSLIVGKPISMLLLAANATVTTTHSRTADLAAHTREADVLIVAVGQVDVVTADMVKPGATVVDVGMNRTEDGLRGDVDPAAVEVAGLITPVPGGVGPMTIASLLRNTLEAGRRRRC